MWTLVLATLLTGPMPREHVYVQVRYMEVGEARWVRLDAIKVDDNGTCVIPCLDLTSPVRRKEDQGAVYYYPVKLTRTALDGWEIEVPKAAVWIMDGKWDIIKHGGSVHGGGSMFRKVYAINKVSTLKD